ncbi:PstS family phosphate ABC transporter substrate-binding protein [Aliikangiella sp. IMCC44653]
MIKTIINSIRSSLFKFIFSLLLVSLNFGSTIASSADQKIKAETLKLVGSNTIGESFAPLLAESFLKNKGAILVRTETLENPVEKNISGFIQQTNTQINIQIRAHGSTTGFNVLLANQTDIAMSSRPVKTTEVEALKKANQNLTEEPIALDALAIITHPDNPISQLTITQIGEIFSGNISNWKQLGGPDMPITIYARDNNSGTWDTFKNIVLKPFNLNLNTAAKRFESSQQLVSMLSQDNSAIGFVGVSYIAQAKVIAVAATQQSQASTPSVFTIGTQAYPLSRKLFLYANEETKSQLAKEFLSFCSTHKGQQQAPLVDLISYYPTYSRPQALTKATPLRYRNLASLATRLTVSFAAHTHALDPTKEARDIERLSNFSQQSPGRKFVLVATQPSSRLKSLKEQLTNAKIGILDTLQFDLADLQKQHIEVWVL